MQTTSKSLKWTHQEMVSYFVRPTSNGFTAAECHTCRKTANLPGGSAVWFCPCGADNMTSHIELRKPHKKPDYGPTRIEIYVAIQEAHLKTLDERRRLAGGPVARALFDAESEASLLNRVKMGEQVLLVWSDLNLNHHAKVFVPEQIKKIGEAAGRPVNSVHIGGASFLGGALGEIISEGKSEFYHGRIVTKRYAAILLHSMMSLGEQQRQEFFSLIRPGEPFPSVEAALEELEIRIEATVED